MGVDLELVLPEKRKNDKKVIDYYYSFVFNKMKRFRPGISIEELFTCTSYKFKLEVLEGRGYVWITERIYSDIRRVLDWKRTYELFGGIYKVETTIIYGDKIRELILILKEAKEKLVMSQNKDDPDWTDWEYGMETQVIALCEYALENNFGIRLSE